MVKVGLLDDVEQAEFLSSLNTVSSQMGFDGSRLRPEAFLEKYGHLRPGTYDINSPRYDEAPDQYFDWSNSLADHETPEESEFALSLRQLGDIERLLAQHGLEHNVLSLFQFLKCAIEGREQAKFVFTRSLSHAMTLIRELGAEHGLSTDDCSYLDAQCVRQLYSSGSSIPETLRRSVEEGRMRFEQAKQVILPPLITSPNDVYQFHLPASDPNFITLGRVVAPVRSLDDPRDKLPGAFCSFRAPTLVMTGSFLIVSADWSRCTVHQFTHGHPRERTWYSGCDRCRTSTLRAVARSRVTGGGLCESSSSHSARQIQGKQSPSGCSVNPNGVRAEGLCFHSSSRGD